MAISPFVIPETKTTPRSDPTTTLVTNILPAVPAMALPTASSTLIVSAPPAIRYAPEVKCNCYLYVKAHYPSLPHMDSIVPNAKPAPGAVAIFDYGYEMHFSIITNVTKSGFTQKEANYHPCTIGSHFTYYDDPHLVGYWKPAALS